MRTPSPSSVGPHDDLLLVEPLRVPTAPIQPEQHERRDDEHRGQHGRVTLPSHFGQHGRHRSLGRPWGLLRTPDPTVSVRRTQFVLLASTGMLSASGSVVFALMGNLQDEYGFADIGLGIIAATGFAMSFLVQILIAPLADKGHTKTLLLAGTPARRPGQRVCSRWARASGSSPWPGPSSGARSLVPASTRALMRTCPPRGRRSASQDGGRRTRRLRHGPGRRWSARRAARAALAVPGVRRRSSVLVHPPDHPARARAADHRGTVVAWPSTCSGSGA